MTITNFPGGVGSFGMPVLPGNIPISLLANTTGFVCYNSVASGKTAIAGQVAVANCYATNNYANNTVNTSGLLDPVVDS